ncbi:hypothetical protein PCANC_09476 [Puccinia coronata f. sp. avenae]|uniref:Uncharacterized protein n=1 Tax=Puccinia coronata f. sp. avenae TaxID=200324 RepID=A0A2N5VVM6_9BASI|nr:hypothetical protein PCANC_09476 [Puccinia coronata f. sp. avenae]
MAVIRATINWLNRLSGSHWWLFRGTIGSDGHWVVTMAVRGAIGLMMAVTAAIGLTSGLTDGYSGGLRGWLLKHPPTSMATQTNG